MTKFRKLLATLAAVGVLSLGGLGAATAQANDYYGSTGHYGRSGYSQHSGYASQSGYAQHGGYAPYSGRVGGYSYGGYSHTPHYHAPSVHYDRVYHADTYHWTPGRGLHTHGHYDLVPHYTPGHFHH